MGWGVSARGFVRLVAAVALALVVVPAAQAASGRIVVRFEPGARAHAAALERQLGTRVVERIPELGVHVLAGARGSRTLEALERDPAVHSAERETVLEAAATGLNDPFFAGQWSLRKTSAPEAWQLGGGSAEIVVAVLDTGVDGAHPDLQGKLVAGYDTVNGDTEPTDDHGHGTAVAGIIAALSNNRLGVGSYCWRCLIMPVKVLAADGRGSDAQVAAGIVWAADHGARIVNLSLGGPDASDVLAAAVAYARARGVLVVAAAGNEASSAPFYPAASAGVIGVAASDEADRLYPWSNSGGWVALAAPGENTTTTLGGGYGSFSGTSSAAPVVAGIAGLALSAAPAAGAAAVEQALRASAVPVEGVSVGRIDAQRTLAALLPAPPSPSPPKATRTAKRS